MSYSSVATLAFTNFSSTPQSWGEVVNLTENWLGRRVAFRLCGVEFTGEVIEVEKFYLCNGIHEILTVEIENERKQVKVQLHRQACRRLE